MQKSRRSVVLENFAFDEGQCSCGKCKKQVCDELMVRLQAFRYILKAKFKCEVMMVISGGARCLDKQAEVYHHAVPLQTSYHTGPNRDGIGDSAAADIKVFQVLPRGEAIKVPRAVLAFAAKQSGLFGGVIHIKYQGDDSEFIHVDLGPVREL